jgi:hypothetical protein
VSALLKRPPETRAGVEFAVVIDCRPARHDAVLVTDNTFPCNGNSAQDNKGFVSEPTLPVHAAYGFCMEASLISDHPDAFAEVDDDLLDGEASADIHDPHAAQRWVEVYSELVTYKEGLVPVWSMWAAAVSPEAALEMAGIIQHRLVGERLIRYRRRLEYWRTAAEASG